MYSTDVPAKRTPQQKAAAKQGESPAELSPRDHRKSGTELELFLIDPLIGSGLPLWLPKGAALRRALEQYVMDEELASGYQHVVTPHLGREELYEASGHLPYYRESMFPPMVADNERFIVKPMNCPHHVRIYQARPRSYRELPLRIAEFGTVYRYEKSGQLQGLTRVRGMTMNDAHIFCTEEQLESEIRSVLELMQRIYRTFGLKDFWIDFALHDPKKKKKYADQPVLWKKSETALRTALKHAGVQFTEAVGDAAFYGPKADIQMKDAAGHTFTVSTIQLDMLLPERLDVTYTAATGKRARPVIIHRALIGTLERFIAFLIEHFEGKFPLWLAPIQVRILPVSQNVAGYASKVSTALRADRIRVEVDDSNETLPKKIRNAETQKIPVMAILGEREQQEQTVTIRLHGGKNFGSKKLSEAIGFLAEKIAQKSLTLP
ncbi:MAG: threonyl-tRNA synthetase [Parcubacteria group bacterium Gr01-1014_38]|nr:MAG: threonyl-tRNA synthetase [Parcubacteria group bacterium Gr01-1014_38]